MVQPHDGQPLRMLSNHEKERLRHIPMGYAATGTKGTMSERDRGRVIGNGWHLGIARMFMVLALLTAQTPRANARSINPDGPNMMAKLCTWYSDSGLRAGPPDKQAPKQTADFECPRKHITYSQTSQHPMALLQPMNPTLHFALAIQKWLGPDIIRVRQEVIKELTELIEDMHEATQDWFTSLPDHVQQAYTINETTRAKKIVQVPAFIRLLQMTKYPQLEELRAELYEGFEMLGNIHDQQDGIYKFALRSKPTTDPYFLRPALTADLQWP